MAESEIKKYLGKIRKQRQEITNMRTEIEQTEAAMREMSALVDSVLIEAANTWGESTDRGKMIRLPMVSVSENTARYRLAADADREAGVYILTARPLPQQTDKSVFPLTEQTDDAQPHSAEPAASDGSPE